MKLLHPVTGLSFIGLIPALAILFLIRLEDGVLVVLGQPLSEYDLPGLLAGLLSTMRPIWLLVPPALVLGTGSRGATLWLMAMVAPFLLAGPSLLAGFAVGGTGPELPLVAFAILSLMTLCFSLWCFLLKRYFGAQAALLIYGLVWAASGYLGYLTQYIFPYMDLALLNGLSWLNWLLPQLQSGPDAVDNALQGGVFEVGPFLPTLVQIPPLALLVWRSRTPVAKGPTSAETSAATVVAGPD